MNNQILEANRLYDRDELIILIEKAFIFNAELIAEVDEDSSEASLYLFQFLIFKSIQDLFGEEYFYDYIKKMKKELNVLIH